MDVGEHSADDYRQKLMDIATDDDEVNTHAYAHASARACTQMRKLDDGEHSADGFRQD